MRQERPLHIGFAPWMVAGVQTQWENMRPTIQQRSDICAHVVELHPYRAGGFIERLPIPSTIKGNTRTMLCAGELFQLPRLDALWVHDVRATLPYILREYLFRHRIPVVSATDSTSVQQAAFGGYYAKAASDTLRGRARDKLDSFCLRRVTVHNPWSAWAAHSLIEDHGIPREHIRVIPPGIDLARWPMLERTRRDGDVMHVLFVGGDFKRKGGDVLLDVFQQRLRGRGQCDLHIVTRDDVPALPGVHVYRDLKPNDERLRALYAHCDIFVLPTQADCFSLASLEAMATGLPVITTTVGGIPEIVADGRSGFLIAPGDGAALSQRVALLVESPERRRAMGLEGRRIVESRFDAVHTTSQILDLLVDLCHSQRTHDPYPAPG